MNMLQMSDARRLASVGFAALFLLTADSTGRAPETLVAYLGSGADPEGDFRYFLELAHAAPAAFPRATRFEMFAGPGHDALALDGAVVRATAAHATVIVASTARAAKAALRRGAGTPLVFASADDPVVAGLVTDMHHRREPVTGVFFGDRLDGKRLELLKDAYPGVDRVGVIGDADWKASQDAGEHVEEEGRRLGLKVTTVLAETPEELRRLLDSPAARRFDAWYLPRPNVGNMGYRVVIDAMRRLHKPCIFSTTTRVDAGGLMAYAQDETFMWAAMVELAARVVAGEDAGSIPVMLPRTFVLAVRTSPDTQVAAPDIRVVRRADIVLR